MKIKRFESFTNSIFKIGKSYKYDELPEQVKDDIDLHFENQYEESPYDYKYVYKIIPYEELGEKIENHFGREWEEYAESENVQELIKDIEKNGLNYPSVGNEGNHRMLAHYILNRDLPYLEMVFSP